MRRFIFGLPGLLILIIASARADVTLPGLFSDHMVLQRDMVVPIWGEALPGETVTVQFRRQEKTATADAKGRWLVKLDPLAAGGPDTLIIRASKTVEIDDVLVGEVWVGSGQSNMTMGTWTFTNQDAVLMEDWNAAPYPGIRQSAMAMNGGHWQVATSINTFPALLFSYGLRLHKELGVPVGLLLAAVSGSASSCWLSQAMLDADPACQAAIKKYAASFDYAQYDAAMKKYTEDLAAWEKLPAAGKPAKPQPPVKPGEGSDGGVGCLFNQYVQPIMPYGIRGVFWDQGESGTALAGVGQYQLMGALIRGWRRAWGQGDFPFIYTQKPSGCGCAWDPSDPVTKRADPFGPLPATASPDDGGALQMFDKIKIMTYPKTAMAISSDLGSGTHPLNKSGYGHRAADVALGFVYGRTNEYYGPIYNSHKIEGAAIRVSFAHVGPGLAFRHGDKLQGFAIAGPDKVWHWADAKIDGATVVVSSDKVSQPVAVRYAWAGYRPWANLFNKDGLPALPFSTNETPN